MLIDLPAVGVRTAAIAAGAVVLLMAGTYGVGYWKGSRARASTVPAATVTDRQSDKAEQSQARTQSVRAVTANEDTLETRLTLPDIVLPDGSRKSQVRITRATASKEESEAFRQQAIQAQVVERVVERKVVVPGPCPDTLVSPFPQAQPRWVVGPSVGRNFKLEKTVYGGGLGLRLGPVWLRLAADSDPSASVGMEVQFD